MPSQDTDNTLKMTEEIVNVASRLTQSKKVRTEISLDACHD